MQKSEFDIALEKEIESLVGTYPGVSFYPWVDTITDTIVISVVPSEVLNTKDFAISQLDVRKRLSKLFPEAIITFRSPEDEYFPFKGLQIPNSIVGHISYGSAINVICSSGEFGGFERVNLVTEDTILSQVNCESVISSKTAFIFANSSIYSSTYTPNTPTIYSDAA